MPDVHLRLMLYKRIAAAPDAQALDDLQAEMIDRFGPLPPMALNLFQTTRLKRRVAPVGIRRLEIGPLGGAVQFDEQHGIDPARVLKLIQREAKIYRLDGPLKLRFTGKYPEGTDRFKAAEQILVTLGVA
jgi:transcription-repair coupling factor (superfamily II helicase)